MSLYQIRDLRICKANLKSRYVSFERQGQCLFIECSKIIKLFLQNEKDVDLLCLIVTFILFSLVRIGPTWNVTSCAYAVSRSRRCSVAPPRVTRAPLRPPHTLHTRCRPTVTLNPRTTHAPIIICLGMSIVD